MASTYSDLKIELIGTGEQSGTWGTTTNVNLNTAIGEAITGTADVAFSSADVTLTLTNTNAAQTARNLRLNLTGTSGGARNLILGSGCQIEKFYLVNNGLADAVTVKNTTGAGVTVPAGKTMFVFNNAVDVLDVLTYFSGTVVSSAATITGGTINSTTIGASTASSGRFTSLEATGNTILGDASGDTITANAATMSVPNNLYFSGTGSVRLPNGTTGERPTPADGMIRYNTTTAGFEGYTTTGWGNIGGGASAGGAIYENKNTISASYTLTTNYNGMSVGPLTIDTGVVVTVPSGQRWVIL
jgi:hypothetical protein